MVLDNNGKGLYSLLMKVVDASRLREELTRIGFSKSETVKVSIETFDGETLATCQIQTSRNEFESGLSLTDFREDFISFLNQDCHGYALIEALPDNASYRFSVTSSVVKEIEFQEIVSKKLFSNSPIKLTSSTQLMFSMVKRSPCPYDPDLDCCVG